MASINTTPTVIAVGNQKGGVGKTTTAVNLSAALGVRGHRVLLIDLDPAAGATRHLGIDGVEFEGTLELLCGDAELEPLAVTDGMPAGVSLIPARHDLTALDQRTPRFMDHAALLRPVIEQAGRYDFIILDTSPHPADVTTLAAYGGADWFLLTALPHYLSLAGITEACRDIAEVRAHRNPSLEVLGVLLCSVDERATRALAEIRALVDNALPGRFFSTRISQATAVQRCVADGGAMLNLPEFRRHPVARQYLRLAVEVERRVQHPNEFRDYCSTRAREGASPDNFFEFLGATALVESARAF